MNWLFSQLLMRDPPQSDSQLIWKYHNFYNQFLDKVYINVKFIYQMFTRWRFRLATEFVKWMYCCVVWTMDIRPESCKRNRWFPCVGIFPNITLGKPFLIRGGNMLSWNEIEIITVKTHWSTNLQMMNSKSNDGWYFSARCSQFQIVEKNHNIIFIKKSKKYLGKP